MRCLTLILLVCSLSAYSQEIRRKPLILSQGGTPEKPVGTVCISVVTPHGGDVRRFTFIGPREMVKFQSTQAAMNMLRLHLADAPAVYRD